MMQNVAKGPFSFADQYVVFLTFSYFIKKKLTSSLLKAVVYFPIRAPAWNQENICSRGRIFLMKEEQLRQEQNIIPRLINK